MLSCYYCFLWRNLSIQCLIGRAISMEGECIDSDVQATFQTFFRHEANLFLVNFSLLYISKFMLA